MSGKIKWGVLGYARIAKESVIPAICRSENSEFYAIASQKEESIKDCLEKFKCEKAYQSYMELLEDPDVDAVYIPLPNSMHYEWALKAAKNKKHILCEKPAALSRKDAEKMIEECFKNNVLFMEGFMYRYTDRVKKINDVIKSGALGEIKYITSSYRFFLNRTNTIKMQKTLGGGSLFDVGCYPINFIGMILNDLPVSVSSEAVLNDGVDVMFAGTAKYSSGAVASVSAGFNAYNRVYSEIVGTKGVLEAPDTFLGNAGKIILTEACGKREIEVSESDRYLLEIEDFAQSIIDKRKPLLSTEETLRNIQVLEKFYKIMK